MIAGDPLYHCVLKEGNRQKHTIDHRGSGLLYNQIMDSDELIGLFAAFFAAITFGSYGVPMKGEAATKVDVDPLVFQTYKAVTVFGTSTVLICINNMIAKGDDSFHKWTLLDDFTPWAFVSALLWVPGGTAGVYAIRRAGLAISVGIWSCVIVILSFIWGVLIFGEKQKSAVGAVGSVAVLCMGLCGIAYFSSVEVVIKKNEDKSKQTIQYNSTAVGEGTPLVTKDDISDEVLLDLEHFPHSGVNPHSHQTIDLHLPSLHSTSKYHIGLCMAVVNGVLAATIMVPLHYAPPNTTQGVGYSMSFGIAAVLVVILFWILRFGLFCVENCICHTRWIDVGNEPMTLIQTTQLTLMQIPMESILRSYKQLPPFHIRVMWRPGLLSGILYSLGNLFGIVSIQKLGNFMGYSLNQSSMIISGEFYL